jgi:hypothetical protein
MCFDSSAALLLESGAADGGGLLQPGRSFSELEEEGQQDAELANAEM